MASVDSVIKKNQSQSDILYFPKKIGKYGMLFMFADYNYDSVNKTITDFDIGKYKGSVVLPLPKEGLNENSSFRVNDEKLSLLGATVAGGFSDYNSLVNKGDFALNIGSSYKDYASAAGGAIQTAGALAAIVAAMSKKGGEVLGGAALVGGEDIMKGISVGTGQTTNDFDALTFDGVQLRNHSFSWSLYPESAEDTIAINNIKKKFQAAAHPTYTSANSNAGSVVSRILFDYPQMVLPIILIGDNPNGVSEHYFQFKPCLIKSVKFSYKGDAGMSFFRNGAPASVEMTLEMTETGIWTGEDYERDGSGVDRAAATARAIDRIGQTGRGDL